MKALLKRFVREDEGQDLIEYALLAGFISLIAIIAITNVGQGINGVYTNINGTVAKIPPGIGS
jgi:pilus assembly protein Flp/PilA